MKRKIILSILILFTALTSSADVVINEQNFPDEGFRNFLLKKKYGKDGILTDAEITNIKKINLRHRWEIHNLRGIEYLTALNILRCDHAGIEELDLSKNNALTELWCGVNWNMNKLDISGCTQLKFLECVHDRLKTLDVSKNVMLEKLYCSGNELTKLDLSKNNALTFISCGANLLTSLDVSNNTALTVLGCSSNMIKGAEMDTLIESLPTVVKKGKLQILAPREYREEQNELSKTQVAAIWEKGWIPFELESYEWKAIKVK